MTLLASRNRRSISDAALQNLGSSRGPHLSIRGGRFHLVNGAGVEQHIDTHYLDMVIMDANPNTSKVFFAYDYDPNADAPPECFSDNGTGPSTQAMAPQAPTCTVCPWNFRGSDTTFSGKPTKACQDRKKVAFIIPDDATVTAYEFQIPPGSITSFKQYNQWISQQPSPVPGRKLDIADVVTRVEFDPDKQFTLKFSATQLADDERTIQVVEYIDANKLSDVAVGRLDLAWDPEQAKLRIASAGAAQIQQQPAAVNQAVAQPAAPQQPAQPAAFTLPQQQQPAALAAPPAAGAPAAPGRRGRRPNAAATQAGASPQPAGAAAPFMAGAAAAPAGAPAPAPLQQQPPAAQPAQAGAAPHPLAIPSFLQRDPQNQPPAPAQPGDRAGIGLAPPPPPAVQNALAGAMALQSRRPAG